MVQTVSRAVLLALIPALAYSGISYSQTTLDSIRALQEHRNELFQKISPGIVSIELVHRSLPAWELAQIERWANEFRLQPWRFGNLSDEEAELWRNWCDAFLMEMENRISKGKIDAGSESPSNLKDFLHDNLQEWQARERTFLVKELLARDPEVYPEGLVTGRFLPLTHAAVKRFQEKHGIAKPGVLGYGVVGPATRAKIAELYSY